MFPWPLLTCPHVHPSSRTLKGDLLAFPMSSSSFLFDDSPAPSISPSFTSSFHSLERPSSVKAAWPRETHTHMAHQLDNDIFEISLRDIHAWSRTWGPAFSPVFDNTEVYSSISGVTWFPVKISTMPNYSLLVLVLCRIRKRCANVFRLTMKNLVRTSTRSTSMYVLVKQSGWWYSLGE